LPFYNCGDELLAHHLLAYCPLSLSSHTIST
jgi:hypothetical protein